MVKFWLKFATLLFHYISNCFKNSLNSNQISHKQVGKKLQSNPKIPRQLQQTIFYSFLNANASQKPDFKNLLNKSGNPKQFPDSHKMSTIHAIYHFKTLEKSGAVSSRLPQEIKQHLFQNTKNLQVFQSFQTLTKSYSTKT